MGDAEEPEGCRVYMEMPEPVPMSALNPFEDVGEVRSDDHARVVLGSSNVPGESQGDRALNIDISPAEVLLIMRSSSGVPVAVRVCRLLPFGCG